MKSKLNKNVFWFGSIFVYVVIAAVSFLVFKQKFSGGSSVTPIQEAQVGSARTKIDPNLPRTEVCPINGAKFTTVERGIWENRRPITAIVENHLDSRPQSGLSKADIVYEVVAEGGITRFLGVFYCGAAADDVTIGPVRSARVYLVKWAYEYGVSPIFVHVGGANNIDNKSFNGQKVPGQVAKEVDAFKLLTDIGWRYAGGNDMDGGTSVGFPTMWRDPERIPGAAMEHTFMGSTDKLYEEGAKRGFGPTDKAGASWNKTYVPWKFTDGVALSSPKATDISFGFWKNKPDYDVEWKYDQATNQYLRFNGGKAHTDMNDGKQLTAKNIVFQFMKEKGPVDKEYHMYYENFGTGKAMYFINGDEMEGTWKRQALNDRTVFYDQSGKEMTFDRGVVWVEGVPSDDTVNFK